MTTNAPPINLVKIKLPKESPVPKPPKEKYLSYKVNKDNENIDINGIKQKVINTVSEQLNIKHIKYQNSLAENLKNKINEEFYKHLDKGDSVDIESVIEEIEKIIKKHYPNNDKIKISIEPVNALEFKIVIEDETNEQLLKDGK